MVQRYSCFILTYKIPVLFDPHLHIHFQGGAHISLATRGPNHVTSFPLLGALKAIFIPPHPTPTPPYPDFVDGAGWKPCTPEGPSSGLGVWIVRIDDDATLASARAGDAGALPLPAGPIKGAAAAGAAQTRRDEAGDCWVHSWAPAVTEADLGAQGASR